MVTAVMRTVAVNAVRGQVRSQQLFSKLLSDAEQARSLQTERIFDTALKYKVDLEEEFSARLKEGSLFRENLGSRFDDH
jgi:hypothetical protein